MHFEIFLLGRIPSGKGNKNPDLRRSLRLQIHEQSKNLWNYRPLSDRQELLEVGETGAVSEKFGKTFVTPIRERLHDACRMEVTFYEPAGSLEIKSEISDPDNRLAALLDLLAIPTNPDAADGLPETCFTLLEDDKLVWSIDVQRRRLLRTMEQQTALTRIVVRVFPTAATLDNPALIDIPVH